jgi:DNA invertase Pin-like site-specific DNA recombinase
MKVVIYSRVSTSGQDFQRQTTELSEHALKMGYSVLGVFEEKISGGKKNEERPKLVEMVDYVKTNQVDKVLVWELSRLGRNTIQVLQTIELLNTHCISLFIKNFNIETLDQNCKPNLMSNFMIQILTSVAEMEKSTIRQRMKSGYDNFRNNGGSVGRKEGFRKDNTILLAENKDVAKLLKQGLSVRKVMKLTDKSSGLVMKVKKALVEAT